ncbi:MAG: hypothetical protein V4538_12690 [Bacteroidota bacterium]
MHLFSTKKQYIAYTYFYQLNMMPTTPINPAISPEVTQTDTPTNGETPAEALGNLYENEDVSPK